MMTQSPFQQALNRAALGFKDPRFFRVKRLAQRGSVRKGIARDSNAKILALFVVFRDGGFGKPRFLRGFLNEAFIVAGNPQLFATASPISRPPLPYWRLMQMIVRSIFFAPVLHFFS